MRTKVQEEPQMKTSMGNGDSITSDKEAGESPHGNLAGLSLTCATAEHSRVTRGNLPALYPSPGQTGTLVSI